jgi:hypothetical protein
MNIENKYIDGYDPKSNLIELKANALPYADGPHVKVTETYDPEHYYHFKGVCHMGCKTFHVRVLGGELFMYRNTPTATIQSALSNKQSDREWLKNGFCEDCWEALEKKKWIKPPTTTTTRD